MELLSKMMGVLGNKENLIYGFLAATVVALGARSSQQQNDIEVLEAEKSSLRSSNKAMQSSMWAWRQHLFHLAESEPSSFPIPLSRLRAIYGEDEPPLPEESDPGLREDATENPTIL